METTIPIISGKIKLTALQAILSASKSKRLFERSPTHPP